MPDCREGINWFLVADPVLNISVKQMNVLQSIKNDHNTEVC